MAGHACEIMEGNTPYLIFRPDRYTAASIVIAAITSNPEAFSAGIAGVPLAVSAGTGVRVTAASGDPGTCEPFKPIMAKLEKVSVFAS